MPKITLDIDGSIYELLKSISREIPRKESKKTDQGDFLNLMILGGLMSLTVEKWGIKEYAWLSRFYEKNFDKLERLIDAISG